MITIMVADDHHLVREALSQMLQTEPGFQVVGQASNAEEAIEKAKLLGPQVVLMDIHMPRGAEGIEATRQITARNPEVKVIMLTIERHSDYLFDALKAGARGYLLKNAKTDELFHSIRATAAGEATLDPSMAHKLLNEFQELDEETASPLEQLTNREIDILRLLREGASNQDIAKKLGLSEKTVRNRLSGVYGKLHINNRTQAALYASDRDLSKPDPST